MDKKNPTPGLQEPNSEPSEPHKTSTTEPLPYVGQQDTEPGCSWELIKQKTGVLILK